MPDIFLTDKDKRELEAKLGTKADKSEIKTKFSADDINAGKLLIKHGGTGADNAEDALKNLGALAVEFGTYEGTHASGTSSGSVTLTFSRKPAVVFITPSVSSATDRSTFIFTKDAPNGSGCSNNDTYHHGLTWNGNSVTIGTTDDDRKPNCAGVTYQYTAVLL